RPRRWSATSTSSSTPPRGRTASTFSRCSVTGKAGLVEREAASLPGYLGMGPVRIGNQAYAQNQHDVYGAAVLAAAHVFFDARLAPRNDQGLFRQLERL